MAANHLIQLRAVEILQPPGKGPRPVQQHLCLLLRRRLGLAQRSFQIILQGLGGVGKLLVEFLLKALQFLRNLHFEVVNFQTDFSFGGKDVGQKFIVHDHHSFLVWGFLY